MPILDSMIPVIVEVADKVGVDRGCAAAVIEQESGGKNIFGCDYIDGQPHFLCHLDVTEERVEELRAGNYDRGMNGVGPAQLTWYTLVDEAVSRGGAHIPRVNMEVGFEHLKASVERLGIYRGLAAYNAGETNWEYGKEYADAVFARIEYWRQRLGDYSDVRVKASDFVAACRHLIGVWYDWWEEGDPIPKWIYEYPQSRPPRWWFDRNGVMCSDLINAGRMECGLDYIGGTPAYYDWLVASGMSEEFAAEGDGVPGALIVNPGVWRGGYGQGHICAYTDTHTLIQATDGTGDFAGVNEGEDDRDTVSWWTPWIYSLQPDIDYSEYMGSEAPEPEVGKIVAPRWTSVDREGWHRADGPDWSRGWYPTYEDGTLGPWKGPGEA